MRFFVDGEEEGLFKLEEFLLLSVLIKRQFGLFHGAPQFRLLHGAHHLFVTRLAQFDFIEQATGFFGLFLFMHLPGFTGDLVQQCILRLDQSLNMRLPDVILVGVMGDRPGNDERGASFIDQDRINLVHNRKIMPTLHLIALAASHAVVTKIVETKF